MPTRSPARIPAPYALVKLFLRIISLLLSIIVLIFLIYISVRYTRNFGVAYAAIVYAFFLDTAEILALSDRHRTIPQLPPLSLVICELGALGLLVGGCVTMAFADRGEEYEYRHGKYPADPYRSNAVWIQVAMGAFHVLYALLACVDGCRGIRRGT